MKTLIVTLEYPPQIGGIASYITNFIEEYSKYHETVVYAPRQGGQDEFVDSRHAWKVYRFAPFIQWMWPHWLWFAFELCRVARREKIEHIFIHHALPVGYVTWFIKKIFKIPYTAFLHGTDILVVGEAKRRKLSFVLKDARNLVVNSQFTASRLREKIPSLPTPLIVHPCPTDTFIDNEPDAEAVQNFRERLGLSSKKVVLTVGRIIESKGHRFFLEMMPELLAKVPQLVWLIIGTGPLENQLMRRARELKVESSIRFLGSVPAERLRLFYALSDIFISLTIPTADSVDGWGMVFIEAAAARLPVVAGRGGGVDEAVRHLETGVLVDPRQPKEVVRTVVDLLAMPEYAKTLGAAGRARVLENLRWKTQIEGLISRLKT